ncbi:TonB-dependent receptor [Luteimonas sp. J16]|jgi:TonB-dependent receptor|uniref:TonB-dependent receptor n=1 Tax=unclassified Luteimonas TaxID=2629088 RepID=UPI0004792F59|nr:MULTISPECIES: TonB-dependent receptor [unclassified Luteimonas]TWG90988.1 TonB-dependent receptor [Luteimonas sp. J16]
MKHTHAAPRRRMLASALLLALASLAAQAQDASPATPPGQAEDADTLDAVVVVGIRASLESSMNLKRDAQGVVDGIVAEDIGKFPDTNLAESLQRISGVSIDRSMGEGSRVTVRGVGPDFNLVLLNGRQMPASSIEATNASNSRAFDFANLASESVSAVEVYKTGRAATPTGGIGATINIRTARPFDSGPLASVGLKAVHDASVDNLPEPMQGRQWTGELSGIFADTFADGRFGVALSGSYQDRDFGYNEAGVAGGWYGCPRWCDPLATPEVAANATNPPGPDDVYAVPQNLLYAVNSVRRQRTNGQATLQWAPTETVTATLDYTYAENRIRARRHELSTWFNLAASETEWTDGPIASPLRYTEYAGCYNPSTDQWAGSDNANNCPAGFEPRWGDLAMAGSLNWTRNENKSLGFNLAWEVNDALDLEFDYHSSSAESGADSPYGSNNVIGTAAFVRGVTSVDFSGDFPVLSVLLPPGMDGVGADQMMVTGSSFRNSYMKSEVDQGQLRGSFRFGDYSRLDFGVAYTEVRNRTAYHFTQRDDWGGFGNGAADYDDSLWIGDDMSRYFDRFPGSGNAFGDFFVFDFLALRDAAIAARGGDEAAYLPPDHFSTDRRTTEKSRSAYVQWSDTFGEQMPLNVAVGVRYEETDVISSALVPIATGLLWTGNNEFSVQFGDPDFTTLRGSYDYWLPSIDLGLELADDMLLRASYGHSIGRPQWNHIQGGQTIDSFAAYEGGTGSQGDPGLKPLESRNLDLSFEWYYGEGSYVSVGWFRKDIDNYIGTSVIETSAFDLRTPVGGALFNEAVANGCVEGSIDFRGCVRRYILENYAGTPGVVQTGVGQDGQPLGTIAGMPGDPLAVFRITVPVNRDSSQLDGWELNVQHMFGDTGFGLAANYTIVDSDLTYDDRDLFDQFALVGLSDSANLVAFYDKGPWQVRAAYNWRDRFLASTYDSWRPNPVYVEDYGQLDLNISYQVNEHLSLHAEAINLTDETARTHGRDERQVFYATQTGPRYMLGLRYRF